MHACAPTCIKRRRTPKLAPLRASPLCPAVRRRQHGVPCAPMPRQWTEASVRRELEAFLPGFEAFPPYPVFRATGRRGLWQAIAKRGGPERFAEDYGLPYTRNDRALTDAEIRERLRAALRASDLACWPSRHWITERGGNQLVAAIERTGGARRWADELGLPVRHRRGQRWTPEKIAAALEPLLVGPSGGARGGGGGGRRRSPPPRGTPCWWGPGGGGAGSSSGARGSGGCGSPPTTARGTPRSPPATGWRSNAQTCRRAAGSAAAAR